MDGSVSVLDAEEGTALCTTKAHSKYCVQATWNSSGTGFVTASWDQSLCIYEWPAGQRPSQLFVVLKGRRVIRSCKSSKLAIVPRLLISHACMLTFLAQRVSQTCSEY